MPKYYPEIEILNLLHKSGEMDGCSLLKELSKLIPSENNSYYLYLVDVMCDLHNRELIKGVPAPNIQNTNCNLSITQKGKCFLELHLAQEKQNRQENIHKWVNTIIAALAFLTSIPALMLSIMQLLQK